jgi:hypothetical protein
VRDGLRNLADFALGRTAEEEDYVALYALGVE